MKVDSIHLVGSGEGKRERRGGGGMVSILLVKSDGKGLPEGQRDRENTGKSVTHKQVQRILIPRQRDTLEVR